jgi:hypothetical protein
LLVHSPQRISLLVSSPVSLEKKEKNQLMCTWAKKKIKFETVKKLRSARFPLGSSAKILYLFLLVRFEKPV